MNLFRLLLAPILLLLLSACSTVGPDTSSSGSVPATPAPAPALADARAFAAVNAPSMQEPGEDYRIGPLDVLDISVFQVPDLTKTVHVSATGTISLPLIGSVDASGKTVDELTAEVRDLLAAKYLQNPQVTILVKENNSQRVTVDGAVNKPGVYPLNGPTSLLQLVAISGGLADGADDHNLVVFRTVDGQRNAARFDLAGIRSGNDEDLALVGGDIVIVDKTGVSSALSQIKKALPFVGLFTLLL